MSVRPCPPARRVIESVSAPSSLRCPVEGVTTCVGCADFLAHTLPLNVLHFDRFVVVTAKDHALAGRSGVAFAQVLDYDFVGLDRASSLQRFLAGKAVREGRPLRLRVQLRSFDAVCRLVECGVGVGGRKSGRALLQQR